MHTIRRDWKRWILLPLTSGFLFVILCSFDFNNSLESQLLDVFDRTFSAKADNGFGETLLRIRNGEEIFCVQENKALSVNVYQLVTDLSITFGLDWRYINVDDLTQCPKKTTFYVLHDIHLDQSDILDLMLRIVGSTPEDSDSFFPKNRRGFTTSIPGFGNRDFIFIRLLPNVPDQHARSIISEEIIQAVLRASDIPSTKIVSILGENSVHDDYNRWFENNPAGFCSIDILLMEVLLSPSMLPYRYRNKIRNYINEQFEKLVKNAESRSRSLIKYSDSRCWIWK